jgi:excisionase family DNA binding protein
MRPKREPRITIAAADESAQSRRYFTNDEAAALLRLSPRTLEKRRVIGGGPRFHKFGRRVMYSRSDLEAWANSRSFETTCDPEYAAHRATSSPTRSVPADTF